MIGTLRMIGATLVATATLAQVAAADPVILSCALSNGSEQDIFRIEPRGAWQTWNAQASAWSADACTSVRMECERGRHSASQLQVIGGAVGARAYRRLAVNFRTREYRIETWADRLLNRTVRLGSCTPVADPS